MKKSLLIAGVLFCSFIKAQVSIYISSKVDQPFEIGINGFVQNTDPVDQLVIGNLDTGLYKVVIIIGDEEDNTIIKRKLKLIKKGQHRYIITRNFKGKVQLRYRGLTENIPTGTIKMTLQEILPLPETLFVKNDPPSKKDTIPKLPTSLELQNPYRENMQIAGTTPSKEIEQKFPEVKESQNITQPIADSIPKADPYTVLKKEMENAEFEFVKLNLAKAYAEKYTVSIKQLIQLFGVLQYDNSRLQLILNAKEKIIDPENMSELVKEFDYELTRQRFRAEFLK